MAVDASSASLFDHLKLKEDRQWLPPRPWESISSESGLSHSANPSTSSLSYPTSTVSEASLVRLAMNALQGVESALLSIEKLCIAFSGDPADRTFHRIPSLGNWSSSTLALGHILESIGRSGCVVFLLHKFTDYFTNGNLMGKKQAESEIEVNSSDRAEGGCPSYSLVNQAFSIAVAKLLGGYISALDTLNASVSLQRSLRTDNASSHCSSAVGCLTCVGHSEITLLEVYLHTKGIRTQIEALGNICTINDTALSYLVLSFEDLRAKANLEFSKFPRGGNLLNYLYTELKVADPVHCGLLKFLFLRSFDPYCGFIRSWIYKAKINDPYNEFVVDNVLPYAPVNAGISTDFPLATIRGRDGVVVPCFLKDYLIPLLRAGQQLQVLMKLLELCNNVVTWSCTFEDILLPCWSGTSRDCSSYVSVLTFNKESIENLVLARNSYYQRMLEKLDYALTKLEPGYKQVVQHGTVSTFVNNNGKSSKAPLSSAMDDSPISSSTDENDSCLPDGTINSDICSTGDEFSHVEDPLESSECSSLNSSEEQNESEQQIKLPEGMVGLEQKYLSALSFSMDISTHNSLQKPSRSDVSGDVESKLYEFCERNDSLGYFVYHDHNETTLSGIFPSFQSGEPDLSLTPAAKDMGDQDDLQWPIGGLLKYSSDLDREKGKTCLHKSDFGLKMSDCTWNAWEECMAYCGTSKYAFMEEITSKDQHPSGTHPSMSLCSSQPTKLILYSNFLSLNPVLTKISFVHLSKHEQRCSKNYREPLSAFDFSSVTDPCKLCVEKLSASARHQIEARPLLLPDSTASAATHLSYYLDKEDCNVDEVSVEETKISHAYSTLKSKAVNGEDVMLASASGGSGWVSLFGGSGGTANTVLDQKTSLMAKIEIPLDFVIQKCLLEEILLQYRYVSRLTIKFLEEGFDLQEHLLALRHYHFMELADWADLFITSLRHYKWYIAEPDKEISKIQGILEFSIQRSSSERDHNKDRLYVYVKGHSMMPLSSSATGIHFFDFLGLGYKVDWPISIILTPDALRVYAQIFSFLIRVKLAIFSLTDIWCMLKDLMQLVNRNNHSKAHESEVNHFYMLVKLRHQVNHFVSTLQQYVQSQLSHMYWCRFLYKLKHQVKDMLDLESVHMAYLTESLHICFMSDETRSTATTIESILQCAVDFRSQLIGSTWEAGVDECLSSKLSRISTSEVLSTKQTFDKSIKELYLCYLRSPKHGEFSISRFWDFLNYNGYYSEIIGKEMGHCAFLV